MFPKPVDYLAHLLVAAESLQVIEVDDTHSTVTTYAMTDETAKPIKTMPQVLNGLNTFLLITSSI